MKQARRPRRALTRREALQATALSGVALTQLSLTAGCDDDPELTQEGAGGAGGGVVGGEEGGSAFLYPESPWGPTPSVDELSERFAYGVASGDPLQTRVILWTCLTEATEEQALRWRISTRPDLGDVVQEGEVSASPERGFCVKVTVEELNPGSRYYYGFAIGEERSHIGRTLTLSALDTPLERATSSVAVVSCAALNAGYFHVYRAVAEDEEVELVLHLGDYIYESNRYAREEVRSYSSEEEAKTLDDYRARYADHRRDLDLQALHRAHPMIAIWDDHEFANNACPSRGGGEEGEAWEARKQVATQAYHEWLPTATERLERHYQHAQLGPLVELWTLDTRMDDRAPPFTGEQNPREERFHEDRRLIGASQEAWLTEGLSDAQAPWKLVAQQVMMAQLQIRGSLESEREGAVLLNLDQWDGFAAQRARILEHIQREELTGVVVLTGDIHTSWASELSVNPSDPSLYHPEASEVGGPLDQTRLPHGGAIALECVTPSVSSVALAGTTESVESLLSMANPHIKWRNLTARGFLKLKISASELRAQWWHIASSLDPVYQPPLLAAEARATPETPRWEVLSV